ncbi:uncharacterized protein LOC123553729 [Mercenaria mercenaria]|uniref:uncharacterized protein LOC123553729 n=1 Tax=Mercenaria mercenaria TaxID=6596 RepID=UPI00234EADAD|nr:uncharacterized protein LOC123553729 [Mercenaria mercenaria]XP_045199259.2 uncharacterized protein LOC123553729 [Mercenaria mercenaria]XP_045199260.2 uncharacterized protein LOC123553729 [Mercenaria mercenaria]XP_045199261.2 uncharacterized protein LOC123553729 [Mercenaria mercenaria]
MKVVIVVLLLYTTVEGRLCSDKRKAHIQANSHKNQGSINYETVRYGHYIGLDCCTTSGSEVAWMKWSKTADKWQQYLPYRTEVTFYDFKQILAIESSTFEDTGLYKCIVQNSTSVTYVTKFQLDVVGCDKLARGPYPTSPLPCHETTTKEKDTLTLPCTGYFGCAEDGDIRIATWFVSVDKNKKDDWVEATSVDKRYKQIDFQRDNGAVKGSNLTITDVSTIDFNRKYMCLLASPQMVQGQTRLIVTLKNDLSPVFESSLSSVRILVGVCTVAVLSLIVNIIITVLTIHERSRKVPRIVHRTSDQKWTTVMSRDFDNV